MGGRAFRVLTSQDGVSTALESTELDALTARRRCALRQTNVEGQPGVVFGETGGAGIAAADPAELGQL